VRVRVPRRIFPITVICAEEQRGQVIDGLHLNEDAPTAMGQINLTSSVADSCKPRSRILFVSGLRAVSLASRADGDEGPREFGRGGGQVEQMLGRTARASIREGQPLHG
jgi:hypothetical protein